MSRTSDEGPSNVIAFPGSARDDRREAMSRHPAGRNQPPTEDAPEEHPNLMHLAEAAVTAERELSGGISDVDGGTNLVAQRNSYTVAMAFAADVSAPWETANARAADLASALENFQVRTAAELVELALAQSSV